MESPSDAAGKGSDESHREHDRQRVGDRGEHLAGEDLSTLARSREDRLQRAVVVLGRDDVARDERRDQREAPDRHEEQHHERDG